MMLARIAAPLGNLATFPVGTRIVERVGVASDDLARRVLRFATSVGEIGLRFDDDGRLHDGDVLFADDRVVIAVTVLADDVLVFTPASIGAAIDLAHAIGNRHIPIRRDGAAIVVRYDPLLEALAREHAVPAARERRIANGAFLHAHAPHAHGSGRTVSDLSAILHLADAAFPAGGFGHSYGLETAIVDGRVADGASLQAWITSYLVDNAATTDGAAIVLATRDGVTLTALDRRLAVARPNAEIRRADRHLARATLDIYRAMGLADGETPAAIAMRAYASAIDDGRAAGIHALASACGYRAVGATLPHALEAFAATLVAGLVSVAARGVPLGQRTIARTRWLLRDAIATFVTRALATRDIDDIFGAAIACEIDGLRHRTLSARLFAS